MTTVHALTLLLQGEGPLEDRTEDRRIGLNMNYSIIFTEISFSPETSILLQIIQIIHITLWIMPEFDREGRGSLSVLAPRWQITTRLPQTRPCLERAPWGPPDPLFFGRKEGTLSSPKHSLKKKHQHTESNLARRKRSQRYFPLPPVAPFCVGCQPEGIDLGGRRK